MLSMYLPGPHAKRNRKAIAVIVHRYFAGDKKLIEEIIKNSESTEPAALMARNELENLVSPEKTEQELQNFNADLRLKEGQLALLAQQEKLLAQQEKFLAQQGALLEQQTAKIELENFEKKQKLLKTANEAQCLKQIRGFMVVFLQESPIDSKNTSVSASTFFKAYKAYEVAFKQPMEVSQTRFGREICTIQGVTKRRVTVGWIYVLEHAEIRKSCKSSA